MCIRDRLENVFTFIEETLGAGQEMVVFVTELTMNSEIAMFLSDVYKRQVQCRCQC